jgi:hypothetical protein
MPGPDDDCAICYEGMHGVEEAVLTFCGECVNAVHKDCFQQCMSTFSSLPLLSCCCFLFFLAPAILLSLLICTIGPRITNHIPHRETKRRKNRQNSHLRVLQSELGYRRGRSWSWRFRACYERRGVRQLERGHGS